MPRERLLHPMLAVGLWGALCLLAAVTGALRGEATPSFAFALAAFSILLAGELWLTAPTIYKRLMRASGPEGGVLLALWPLAAYLVFALGTGSMTPTRVALAAIYVLTPLLLEAWASGARPGAWQDYAAMAAVFLPMRLGWLSDLFPNAPLGSHYALTILFTINVALAAFVFVRRMEGIGYSIGWRPGWGGITALSFLLVALIDIPTGIIVRFMEFNPGNSPWRSTPAVLVGTFILTAWPEEFLFRGLLQNALQKSLRSTTAAWIAASVLFGLAHIVIGSFPNWRYVVLASIAGFFYGLAWRKTGSIFPAAIVHTLVDVTWHLLFRTL